jgi:hypothetical protein
MPSKREEVLQALLARLQTVPLVKVERNRLRPERLPPEGLIILRDGDVGEPEILLSPLSYVWTHLDDLLMAIATALTADPTLGGLVDLIDVGAPDFDAAAPEGGADVKAAIVSVRLIYETAHPLN